MPSAFLSGSLVSGEYLLLLHLSNSLFHICCTVWSCPAFAQQRLPFTRMPAPQCRSHTSNQCTALGDLAFVCNVIFLWLRDTAHMELESRSLVARVPSWLWSNCNLRLGYFSKRWQRVQFSSLLIISCVTVGRFHNLLGSLFVH